MAGRPIGRRPTWRGGKSRAGHARRKLQRSPAASLVCGIAWEVGAGRGAIILNEDFGSGERRVSLFWAEALPRGWERERATRQPEQARPTVKIAPNNPVFDLPVIVGIEEGLFAKAGLDVSFSATYADREKDSVQTPFMSRVKENLFDSGCADSYNVCEWASIDRLERGKRGGNIAALRAAVAAQAILTFADKLQVPRDSSHAPVMCQELTGSHYTTIQLLQSPV